MNNNTPPSWTGVYSKKEIKKYVEKVYENKIWLKKLKKEFLLIKKNQNHIKNFKNYRPCSIAFICSIYKNIKTIIDVGGSNGWSYYYLKEYCNLFKITNYSILEKNEVINQFENKHKNEKIKYLSNLQKNIKYDLFYSNSTFQYILDDNLIFNMFKITNPQYIVLDDMFIGNIQDFYTLQNYYDYKLPVKFRNSTKFIKSIKKLGYDLIFNEPYICKHRNIFQPLPMNGFAKKFKIEFSQKMFFIRNEKNKR